MIDGQNYMASRLIWKMSTGDGPVEQQADHRDLDPSNDRLSNLRLATQLRTRPTRFAPRAAPSV